MNAVDGEVSFHGSTLVTASGNAELLLMPGVFLRVGPSSAVTIDASVPNRVRIRLSKGECMLEAVETSQPGSIVVDEKGSGASIDEPGLYGFNSKRGAIAVYSGSAQVTRDGAQISVKKGESANVRRLRILAAAPDKATPLYAWSAERSRQLSLESAAAQGQGPAWAWDPWAGSYTFISASGHVDGPFGWPFYAPGHSHNYIPAHPGGDSYLYGPPLIANPGAMQPVPTPVLKNSWPTVPLTAPGVPSFHTSR